MDIIELFEHHDGNEGHDASEHLTIAVPPISFKNLPGTPYCIECKLTDNKARLHPWYYVGADWITEGKLAVHVRPKLDSADRQIDILKMLTDSMRHADTAFYIADAFEVKADKPFIQLSRQDDLLTPLLMVYYLGVLKQIVRKGLKKGYYPVEKNMYCRVKGKVLVSATIKHNHSRNKQLHTQCRYSEFGVNTPENRLLKKALLYVQRFMDNIRGKEKTFGKTMSDMFNYISPSFRDVEEEADTERIRHTKHSPFFKEYREGLRIASLILKRYGYNINNIRPDSKVSVPPFWIDMPKLFELYVLAQLKARYGSSVEYQFSGPSGIPDFLILKSGEEMVADAKYKTWWQNNVNIDDIRQLSGYARDKAILKKMNTGNEEPVTCLIIYSDQNAAQDSIITTDSSEYNDVNGFEGFKKIGVKIPEISNDSSYL